MQEMIQIYDTFHSSEDKMNPIYHEKFKAGIEIKIDAEGTMLNARNIENEDQETLIPVTEKSAMRTSGIEPHPLCDQLQYIADDYANQYFHNKNNEKVFFKDNSNRYKAYLNGLNEWAESQYSHPKVVAILKFIKKGNVFSQLKKIKVLDEDVEESKVKGILVRFIIQGCGKIEECWKDPELIDCYINYYQSKLKGSDVSYLTGKNETKTDNFPKSIRYPGDGAKLLSVNSTDTNDFTFRGRFKTTSEILSIGSIDSQKMHNALKWLISQRGIRNNDYVTVVWESDFKTIPLPNQGTDDLFSNFVRMDQPVISSVDSKTIIQNLFTKEYKEKINPTSSVYLLSFDSATKGRLSLVQQATLQSSQYLENLEDWHVGAEWKHKKSKKNLKTYSYIGVPNVNQIVYSIYGHESDAGMDIKGSETYVNRQVQRLYTCIVLNRPIPKDFVKKAVLRASMPEAFKNQTNWEKILSIACSLVKKEHSEKKEEYTLVLETGKLGKRRDYLYGRLLAIADVIEKSRLRNQNVDRPTNAMRYMNMFSKHPYRTWTIIHESILPYLNGYNEAIRTYYLNLIQSVMIDFKEGDFENDKPLNGLYLLGYYCQRDDIYSKWKEKKQHEINNTERESE